MEKYLKNKGFTKLVDSVFIKGTTRIDILNDFIYLTQGEYEKKIVGSEIERFETLKKELV